MTQVNFAETYKQAEKQYNIGKGEYFKLKEGKNRFRLVSRCLPHPGEFKGKPTFKWLGQVLDRADGKIKPFFMPNTIYKQLMNLQMSEDYAFREVPMPYDLTITATGAGTKEVDYQTLPAKEAPLSAEELIKVNEAPTVEDLQQKIWDAAEKQGMTTKEEAAEATNMVDDVPATVPVAGEVNVEDIPF